MGGLLLTGCAQAPKPVIAVAPEPVVQAAPDVVAEPAQILPNVELSSELLYEYLLTEIANQRGHKALAVEGSMEIAQKTRDPRLAKRAAQLAMESGDLSRAVTAFRFWQELEPEAAMPTRMLSTLLLRGGKLDEARVEFDKVLKKTAPNVGVVFLQIYPMLLSYPDKIAALKLVRELATPYPESPESRWVVAQLAHAAGDDALALNEVREAARLRPEWNLPVALEAQLLNKTAPQQSLAVMARYLKAYPAAGDVRLQYARSLLEQKQYQPAREEFRRLANDSPGNVDLAFAVALISLQLNDLPNAESELRQALAKGSKGQDAVEYFLGQLNEAKEDEGEALVHYREVNTGEYQFSAHLRAAYLLSKQGKLEEARQFIQQARAETDAQRVQLVMIEGQMLRDAGRVNDAYQVMQQGLTKLPNHPDLLYEAAMLADRLEKYDASEKYLRKLIHLKSDHAHAYNALGYSLLERKIRTAEAVALVEKALQLTPDDYAIMDSVGWGYYRAGRLDESVAMLRKAFAGNPDPEIAAHLGEVLWVRGDKAEATQLWHDSLKAHPDSAPLQAVIKRLER